ncbi:family 10 glycosylhydrolase [Pirellulimonas nuda]|uniref:family 10 glycosylhydrolase n=1 Tax=Pirellulimonas nuda TaxID=2528009 RepID=UPI0018D3E3BF|nr:family 10 glycosylhydrolase [Pirellulimonas nuda]
MLFNFFTRAAAPTAILLVTLVQGALAAPAEVRGTWLTTTGPDHIKSGANTGAVIADLRAIGLNTAYVETWKNGYSNFPSQTLSSLTGGPDRSTFLGSRDLVQETLIQSHRNGMEYIGWFEYGFAAQFVGSGGVPSNPLAVTMRDRGWLLRDASGQYGNSSNQFAWMNPAVPEVRRFLIDLTLEAVVRYDLDGVQFDDRLAWPKEFGWDSTTAALYLQETGRSLPTSVNDANFRAWRQSKVTLFASELTSAIEAARPGLHVSVAPSVTSFSDTEYNAPWPAWQNAGLFDEYAPQVYRDNINSFNATLGAQLAPFDPGQRDELVVGLRANGSGANTPYADLQAMIDRVRVEGAAGHSIWYSSAVRDLYGPQLSAYYDVAGQGQADNPFFGPGWRPPAVVGSQTAPGSGSWSFTVAQGGRYRIVAEKNGLWTELATASLGLGDADFQVAGATQVELLIDRRPLQTPDFNGDGLVDAADYTVWRDTLGSTLDLRADANGDLRIDGLDLDRWRLGFAVAGRPGAPARSVPEPAAWVLTAVLIGARRRTTVAKTASVRQGVQPSADGRPGAPRRLRTRSIGLATRRQGATRPTVMPPAPRLP